MKKRRTHYDCVITLKWPSIGCRESRHNVPHTLPLWFCLEIDNRVGFLWKLKLMYFRCHRIFSFYSLWVKLIESAIFSNFTIEHLWPPSKVHFLRALLGTKFSWKFVMSVWACYFREIWLLSDLLLKIQLIYKPSPFFRRHQNSFFLKIQFSQTL